MVNQLTINSSSGLVTAIVRFVEFDTPIVLEDITWNAARLEAWAIIECSMYCISASLLTYRPLLRRMLGRKMDPSSNDYASRGYAATSRTQDTVTSHSRPWAPTPLPPKTSEDLHAHSRASSQTLEVPAPAHALGHAHAHAPANANAYHGTSSDGLYTWEIESQAMAEPKPSLFPVGVTRYDSPPQSPQHPRSPTLAIAHPPTSHVPDARAQSPPPPSPLMAHPPPQTHPHPHPHAHAHPHPHPHQSLTPHHPRNCAGCYTCLYSDIQRSLSNATKTTTTDRGGDLV